MEIDVEQLEIVKYPHPTLREKAKAIEEVTDEVRMVAFRMLELMHEAPGVGLAAPQVGLGWRMFVTNHTGLPEDDMVFINPILSEPSSEREEHDEGCLSLPEINAPIRRPVGIVIEATGLDGERFKVASDQLPARIWQHENDHLDGKLIIDMMSHIDRQAQRDVLHELEDSFQS